MLGGCWIQTPASCSSSVPRLASPLQMIRACTRHMLQQSVIGRDRCCSGIQVRIQAEYKCAACNNSKACC